MSQTVTQKQCTESKTGLGALGAHLDPGCAPTASALRPGSSQRSLGDVSWRVERCIASPASAVSQAWLAVSRIVSPRPLACRCVSCHSSCAVSRACLAKQLRAKPHAVSRPTRLAPSHNTICIATQPDQAMRARAGRPYRGRALRACVTIQSTVS